MRLLIPMLCAALASPVQAAIKQDQEPNQVLGQILKNKPRLKKAFAEKLAKAINKVSEEHGIPAKIYAAILMQESSYQLEAVRQVCGLTDSGEKDCLGTDFGIAQIHYKTIRRYQFDYEKLTNSLDYSVQAGAKVLAWFHRTFADKEPDRWYCRYNVGSGPASKIKSDCDRYLKDVKRWL